MIEVLPGFREFYPEACSRRNYLFQTVRQVCQNFCFQEYDAPILEPLELYTEKSGPEIATQLFNFIDRGGRAVAMRPEMTPAVARMIGSKINSLKRPLKWFSIGENFRYERPQKGRLRSFYQFNIDIFDEPSVSAEAEVLSVAISILRTLGLTERDFHIRLSDRILWRIFLEGLGVAPKSIPQVLSIVDHAGKESEEVLREQLLPFAPASINLWDQLQSFQNIHNLGVLKTFLSSSLRETSVIQERLAVLENLLQRLEYMGLRDFITLDFGIVRGLAYYTGFVFEIFERSGKSRAIAGGGRYDQLIEKFGYPSTPAVGLAFGDVTLQNILSEHNLLPSSESNCDIFVVFDAASEANAMRDIITLRQHGQRVDYALKTISPEKQFKQAAKAHWVARYESGSETIFLRDVFHKSKQILSRDIFLKQFCSHQSA
ncbi:MAG: histidine--tRNA ligase [Verrucomicrobiota bacterium]|nr:MAG: histidine--tRNA ligase [Verrucomicrobiota bacterium]